MTETFFMADAR